MSVCAQLAGITGLLCEPVSPSESGGYTDKGLTLQGAQIGHAAAPRGIQSFQVRHLYACALPTRGGSCDCGATVTDRLPLPHSARGECD